MKCDDQGLFFVACSRPSRSEGVVAESHGKPGFPAESFVSYEHTKACDIESCYDLYTRCLRPDV